MKVKDIILTLFVCLAAAPLHAVARVPAGDRRRDTTHARPAAEKTAPAAPNVTVVVCVEAGDVMVRGWDRPEVRATSAETDEIELRRSDPPGTGPADRLEVFIFGEGEPRPAAGQCGASGSIELNVPRGSTVQIKAPGGDISVTDVAGVRAETAGGEIELRGVTQAVDAASGSGALSLIKSKGNMLLRSISGEIEAREVGPSAPEDKLWIKTTSGEVTLADIGHAHVSATTATSDIIFNGPLTRSGFYEMKTHSGDISLSMPADASFQLSARVYHDGVIDTDFPIRQTPGASSVLLKDGRLTGLHGAADQSAMLNLSSFNGTIELRKK